MARVNLNKFQSEIHGNYITYTGSSEDISALAKSLQNKQKRDKKIWYCLLKGSGLAITSLKARIS